MPKLDKEALSQYIRTGCQRQLRLNLSPDSGKYRNEREALDMPPEQPPRPGLEQIAQAGEAWQAAKFRDLASTFGDDAVVGDSYTNKKGQTVYRAISLGSALPSASAGHFLVEAEYEIGKSFGAAVGLAQYRSDFDLDVSNVRPDIIEVLPGGTSSHGVTPSGDLYRISDEDPRLQLRIIDIKLTSEPSPSYFAEVAYYSMSLAGWLTDNQLDDSFVVSSDGAVWPGSHDASYLSKTFNKIRLAGQVPSTNQLREALDQDLEEVPFEVFAYRVRHFLSEDVPHVLGQDWQDLEWHVDNRCKGCDNLGYPWISDGELTNDPRHCMPTAERTGHLSRIAFIPKGASSVLRAHGVGDVAALALRQPGDTVFNSHQSLRATRSVVVGRASALQLHEAHVPAFAGSSAVMPRWADLHIYLSVDYDLGSAITFAFGVQAFWVEPREYGSARTDPRDKKPWPAQTFLVDLKDLQAEERELRAYLEHIDSILTEAQKRDTATTVQFYVWDSLQYEHLCRVIGRHLESLLADDNIRRLAWLFPPEELLPNAKLATRQSPLTIVRDVVRAVVAAPVPHYYSLLETARKYFLPLSNGNAPSLSVHPLFEDLLSDQIPSERAHEIWTRSTRPYWGNQKQILEETVEKRLRALETVVRRLEHDLGPVLAASAPRINVGGPKRENGLSFDSQLWYLFSQLDSALNALETSQIRAMPPHEREARYRSARLAWRLTGKQEGQALERLGLSPKIGRRVYKLRDSSQEVKLKEGDFNCALAPEKDAGFLDRYFPRVVEGTPLDQDDLKWERMDRVTNVTVAAIDRNVKIIAVDANPNRLDILDDLERYNIVDLSKDVILDPTYQDFFSRKLLDTLRAIGNPKIAQENPQVRRALGQTKGRGSKKSPTTPSADFLWNTAAMQQTSVARSLMPVEQALQRIGFTLNSQQSVAWAGALTHRLQLIWGPPGTGKSRTVQAIVLGAILDAHWSGRPHSVLVCASTHTAMDNVLIPIYEAVEDLEIHQAVEVHRLRSKWRPPEPHVPVSIDTEVNKYSPSRSAQELQARLDQHIGITVVGATPEQIHNLLVLDSGIPQRPFFDLILIDEASQMDVSHAILPLASLAEGGSVVLAGDPKQLPPIHQAEAPVGLEYLVGSVYSFADEQFDITPVMLSQNYRSNATLVEFSLRAGYEPSLTAFSPDLQLKFLQSLPQSEPDGWPIELPWTPEWSALLDPAKPAVCFVYREGRSSQWNKFEAEAVSALVTTLSGRIARQLRNERDPELGQIRAGTFDSYSDREFWEKAVGVVTPHRAQQSLIVSRLQQVLGGDTETDTLIRNAVDTVERFQGQQRDAIIVTFALGDPDAIQAEDEFLLSLNRFNVMSSRARAKLIVLVSQELVDHLSSDLPTLRDSRLLKTFVESFCSHSRPMTLEYIDEGKLVSVNGTYKWAHPELQYSAAE